MKIIGRNFEIEKMQSLCNARRAQFWAVYGRRRIGKTFLVREFFQERNCIYCSVTGEKDRKIERQLAHFQTAIECAFFEGERLPILKNWDTAFEQLVAAIRMQVKKTPEKEIVVFLDELPWLATRKSGLLSAIDHAWNTELQYISNLRLIICGSAASWIIENIVLAKGGLHNRLTGTFRLEPFSLSETRDYVHKITKSNLNDAQILDLYLCMGGVPFYLSLLRPDFSAAQNIGQLFFGNGELSHEFDRLFAPLFDKSETHQKITKALAKCSQGMTREQIVKAAKIPAGRSASVAIKELEEAGFISRFKPVNRKTREDIYRLIDEFCIFYFKWIRGAPSRPLLSNGLDYWLHQIQTSSFASWTGIAFEAICLKHSTLIMKKLGFAAVSCKIGPWVHHPIKKSDSKGAQIDLLFERADKVTTIAEIKYHNKEFVITKKYREELEQKIEVYKSVSKSIHHVSLAIVAPYGLKQNEHSSGFVSGQVCLKDLFEK